jgi:zinc/manganese transport system substrate-binding protein
MQIKSTLLIGLFVLLIHLSNTVQAADLNIVTTLPSLESITRSIGGDYVDVYSITRGAQDAHYIEAKPSYMTKLNRADLLIYSGLELEIGWLPLLIQGARNENVSVGATGNLNASLALSADEILEKPRGEIDRSMGDVHPMGNPHYLLNPYNALDVADLIAEKLIELDPAHTTAYQKNCDAFKSLLENKIYALEEQAADLQGQEIVCYHVHWSYLLNWLGIESAGYVELRPGIPPTPKHKREIIDLMNARQIKVVIISSWKEPTKAKEVAEASHAQLLILPGEVDAMDGVEDYFTWIDYLVRQLCDAYPVNPHHRQPRHHFKHHEKKRGVK